MNGTSPTNQELIDRCLRGDDGAWRTLVHRYSRLVHAVAVQHGLRDGEVDDVGQEVFLALAQGLHRIEDAERLPAWLVTTARRTCWRLLHQRRREGPAGSADLTEADTLVGEPVAAVRVPSLPELLAGWERQALLQEGLSKLGERCRALLEALFLDPGEPSYEQIAARLGMPKGSIGPTRNRCLEQLRAILEGLGFEWRAGPH
ncbi:MAG TPA: sigma-70 family RNA polymerase sigma factor [Caldilineaceae bacterium]|nr:sigma-70 family RNA polymerase sigma factor [Caldilineaceae bacterium]